MRRKRFNQSIADKNRLRSGKQLILSEDHWALANAAKEGKVFVNRRLPVRSRSTKYAPTSDLRYFAHDVVLPNLK